MVNITETLKLETKKQFELRNITQGVESIVKKSGVKEGIVVLSCPHTTASVRLNHDEPLLGQDILKSIYRLVPVDTGYSHDLFELRQNVASNERSNGHAHVKAFLLGSSETLIVSKGQLILGGKQSVLFVELDGGRPRQVHVKIMGE